MNNVYRAAEPNTFLQAITVLAIVANLGAAWTIYGVAVIAGPESLKEHLVSWMFVCAPLFNIVVLVAGMRIVRIYRLAMHLNMYLIGFALMGVVILAMTGMPTSLNEGLGFLAVILAAPLTYVVVVWRKRLARDMQDSTFLAIHPDSGMKWEVEDEEDYENEEIETDEIDKG